MGPTALRRFGLSTLWTIFGLLFFYVALVVMSLYSKGVTLERMQYVGWPRVASRATGAISVPFYVMSLIVSPASLWSLFFTVMTVCSHAVHLMILATDVRVFEDKEFIPALQAEGNHPLLKHIHPYLLYAFGALGYICLFTLGAERSFGSGLRNRSNRLSLIAKLAHCVVWTIFCSFFLDRLTAAVLLRKTQEEHIYPEAFLVCLMIGAGVAISRDLSVSPVVKTGKNKKDV